MHEVLRVLAARAQAGRQPGRHNDGFRVALAIEGGGMRGTVSAGMALALDELGLVPAFDAAIKFHPLATDVTTGQSTDLRPLVGTPAELRLALRASAALPLLAGPPVEFAGRRFYDAGLSESVPYRTALAQGATHVLVLRSRRDPVICPDGRAPSRSVRLITRTTLRRETPALRAVFLSRDARLADDDRRLAAYQSAPPPPSPAPAPASPAPASPAPAPESPPWVFSIRPPAESPQVSRLATDGRLLQAAFEAGRAATRAAFAPLTLFDPSSPLPARPPDDHEDLYPQ